MSKLPAAQDVQNQIAALQNEQEAMQADLDRIEGKIAANWGENNDTLEQDHARLSARMKASFRRLADLEKVLFQAQDRVRLETWSAFCNTAVEKNSRHGEAERAFQQAKAVYDVALAEYAFARTQDEAFQNLLRSQKSRFMLAGSTSEDLDAVGLQQAFYPDVVKNLKAPLP